MLARCHKESEAPAMASKGSGGFSALRDVLGTVYDWAFSNPKATTTRAKGVPHGDPAPAVTEIVRMMTDSQEVDGLTERAIGIRKNMMTLDPGTTEFSQMSAATVVSELLQDVSNNRIGLMENRVATSTFDVSGKLDMEPDYGAVYGRLMAFRKHMQVKCGLSPDQFPFGETMAFEVIKTLAPLGLLNEEWCYSAAHEVYYKDFQTKLTNSGQLQRTGSGRRPVFEPKWKPTIDEWMHEAAPFCNTLVERPANTNPVRDVLLRCSQSRTGAVDHTQTQGKVMYRLRSDTGKYVVFTGEAQGKVGIDTTLHYDFGSGSQWYLHAGILHSGGEAGGHFISFVREETRYVLYNTMLDDYERFIARADFFKDLESFDGFKLVAAVYSNEATCEQLPLTALPYRGYRPAIARTNACFMLSALTFIGSMNDVICETSSDSSFLKAQASREQIEEDAKFAQQLQLQEFQRRQFYRI